MKRKVKWLLGSFSGQRYVENSRFFYEYLVENTNEDVLWITKSNKVYNHLKSKNYPVEYFYSFKAIIWALRSKVVIRSYSLDDTSIFSLLNINSKIYINLSHGIPFKQNNNISFSVLKRIIRSIFGIYINSLTTYILAESKNSIIDIKKIYKPEKIFLAGAPRTDFVLSKKNKNQKKSKTIMYAPTFREYRYNLFDDKSISKMNKFLHSLNTKG
ncbi:hypothetical protein HC864_04715 [Candidatus Gracilibacteria bacterium]|nr:hypothetical protein [Candidatus Gracilibacteria bacterium]